MSTSIEEWTVLVGGGINLAVKTFKGRETHHIIMTHANGLHKELWEPVIDDIRRLGLDWTITTFDFRGHGDSLLGEHPHHRDWWISALDTLFVINSLKDKYKSPLTFVGMGHSFGATVLMMAEVIQKGTFHTLLLTEPVVRVAPYNVGDIPFSVVAAKRKDVFESMEEVVENFISKKTLFATWDKRCFDLHVTKGLRQDPATGKLVLKCSPATEAWCFKSGGAAGFDKHLNKLNNRVFVWYGENSWWTSAFLKVFYRHLTNAKQFVTEEFSNSDHFLPQQLPEQLARRSMEALAPLLREIKSSKL